MDATSTPARVADLAGLLRDRVEQHYGAGPRTEALRAALAGFVPDRRPVDRESVSAMEAAAKTVFRHLDLSYLPGLQPEERSAGWPAPDETEVRRAGAQVAAVHRQADGIAVIRLTGLAPVAAAAPLLAGAFALIQGADALILDLRANAGGDPATVALIADWLIGGAPRHLFDVRYRDRVRQCWTAGAPVADPPRMPVRALIGPGTYSSGEALAWVLQRERLATLVGRPTRGAADHVVPLNLTSEVSALIPEATVVAPDGSPTWEGAGVQPDEADDRNNIT